MARSLSSILLLLAKVAAVASFSPLPYNANVEIQNDFGQPVVNVSLIYKYGTIWKRQHTWELMEKKELSSETMPVLFDAGLISDERNWWQMSWTDLDERSIYVLTPEALGHASTAKKGTGALGLLGALFGAAIMLPFGPPGTAYGSAQGFLAGMMISNSLYNSERVDSFQEHNLRKQDDAKRVTIIINANKTATFRSWAGETSVAWSSLEVSELARSMIEQARQEKVESANQER